MKTIGIIGGLGPMATVYFLEMLTAMTKVERDQEHPHIVLESIPATPDRTDYILGKSKESPLPELIASGKRLVRMGADLLTIPCVTAQYFYEDLSRELSVPVISLCGNVAEEIRHQKVDCVGLLATTGTIQSKVLEREFAKVGVNVVVPSEEMQKLVMELIYGQIKSGKEIQWEMFDQVSRWLLEHGAKRIILGCTELSLLKKERRLETHYVDVLEVLARQTLAEAGVLTK